MTGERTKPAVVRDPERVRNFWGVAVARVGPRAFQAVHGAFLALLVGNRTGSAVAATFALTAHRLVLWLVMPLYGRISDRTQSRLGRRAPYLGGGLILMGIGTWSYTIIDGYWLLVIAIFLTRLANSGRLLAGVTVVPETFGRSRLIQAMVAIGVAGAVISLSVRFTVIGTWDESDPSTWNITFRTAAIMMILAGIVALVLVRDTTAARELASREAETRPWRERLGEILEQPNARLLLAGLFLSIATSGATTLLLPLYNREALGATGPEQSVALIVAAVLFALVSVPGGLYLFRRYSRRTLAVLGPLVPAVGAAGHLVITNIWQSVVIGTVTAAAVTAAVLALLPLYLQLLPRSGGIGERIGLAFGPIALVGVSASYGSGLLIDQVDNYRAMFVIPLLLGVVQAALMTRLDLPAWARKPRLVLRLPRPDRTGPAAGNGARRRGRPQGLFTGDVTVDDADATQLVEVLRHIFGNPYEPPSQEARDAIARSTAGAERLLAAADTHAASLGVPVPVPCRLPPAPAAKRWARSTHTVAVATRHLGPLVVRRLFGRPVPPTLLARRMARTFDRLGAGYAKFGQIMASSHSLVGEDVAHEFRGLLDRGPVVPIRRVRAAIAADLGRPVTEAFGSIDPTPIGQASIAVVHPARTTDGTDVAIKVVRPGIKQTLATDLALLEPLLHLASAMTGSGLTGPMLSMLDGFRRQLTEELDLTNERHSMRHQRALLDTMDLPLITIPEPIDELSGQGVLTVELLDGVPVDDPGVVKRLGADAAPVIEQLVKAWFTAAIRSASFHGDVHAGNLMLLTDGRIAVLDWGIVGRLDPGAHGFLRHLVAGALGDDDAWAAIGRYLLAGLGPAGDAIDADDLLALIRPRLEAILTRPFGEFSLGSMLADAQQGADRSNLDVDDRDNPLGPEVLPPVNRGMFLLGKQLLYFERYGQLHLGELSLLADRDFFTDLLAEGDLTPQ